MKETSKAMGRRWQENDHGHFPWRKLFVGHGLDVGSGDDPLTCAKAFDLPDGGGDDLTKFFPEEKFDFIHGSQVLEHAIDPAAMLRSWIECLKPGGFIIATVPDWELYEKRIWPSKWNAGHKTTWSTTISREGAELRTFLLPEWLNQFLNTERPCEILLCRLVDTNYDHSLGPEVDQTLDPGKGVECFIEFVLHRI